jgi:hypothetical protein
MKRLVWMTTTARASFAGLSSASIMRWKSGRLSSVADAPLSMNSAMMNRLRCSA